LTSEIVATPKRWKGISLKFCGANQVEGLFIIMISPANLVSHKPREAHILRQEAGRCDYDHSSQTRRWDRSELVVQTMGTTGAPTSSTQFDGEGDE
jgi:hypothetical protein